MTNNEGRPTKVMCAFCKGFGGVTISGQRTFDCVVCDNTGSVVRGVDNEKIKLQTENKRLREQLERIKKLANSDRVGHAIKFDLQMMFKEDAE